MEVFSGKNVLQEWLGILSVSRDSLLPPECWSSGFLAGKAVAELEICQIQVKRHLAMNIGEGVILGVSFARKLYSLSFKISDARRVAVLQRPYFV